MNTGTWRILVFEVCPVRNASAEYGSPAGVGGIMDPAGQVDIPQAGGIYESLQNEVSPQQLVAASTVVASLSLTEMR